ncbi:hypothetical protein ACET3Z_026931 [Daucus carota]
MNAWEKDAFIGEYTGELITHDEVDKLCYAYGNGSNLWCTNNSPRPNCYVKDHMERDVHRLWIHGIGKSVGLGGSLLHLVVQRVAKIDLEDAVVPKTSLELDIAHVLLQIGNVILMSASIALSVVAMALVELLRQKRKVTTV